MKIGEFSQLSKTTIKALRYYEEEGLLIPESVDNVTGYRNYTTNQLYDIHIIKSCRQIGLSIADIKNIIMGKENIVDNLEKRRKEIIDEMAKEKDMLSRIEFMLSERKEENIMKYQAQLKTLPACKVYTMETVIGCYNDYFTIIPELGQKIMKKYPDLKCAVPEYCFVRYLDGEYKEKDIHIEYNEAITELKEDFDNIKFKELPSIQVVSVMHLGPYSTIGEAYSFITKWINENGYVITDFPRESYIDGIWNKDNENEYLTEIQFPVKKIK